MKQIVGSIAAGMLITGIPIALGLLFPDTCWWKSAAAICDWPMSLVHSYSFGRNELSRVVIFFLVNITAWSLLTYLVLVGVKKSFAR